MVYLRAAQSLGTSEEIHSVLKLHAGVGQAAVAPGAGQPFWAQHSEGRARGVLREKWAAGCVRSQPSAEGPLEELGG